MNRGSVTVNTSDSESDSLGSIPSPDTNYIVT